MTDGIQLPLWDEGWIYILWINVSSWSSVCLILRGCAVV